MSNGFGSILIGCLMGIPLMLLLIKVRRQVNSNQNSRDHLTSGTPPVHPAPSASKGHDAHDKGGHGGHEHHDHKPDSAIRSLGVDFVSLGVGLLLFLIPVVGFMYAFGLGPFRHEAKPDTARAPIIASASPRPAPESEQGPTPTEDTTPTVSYDWHETRAPAQGQDVLVIPAPDGVRVELCRSDDPDCKEAIPSGVVIKCEQFGLVYDWSPGNCERITSFLVQSETTEPVGIKWRYKPTE